MKVSRYGFFRLGLLMVAVIAPVLYYASIVKFAVNVPFGDDYAMLGFLNDYKVTNGIENKLQLLFSFHNEHRPVVTRMVMLACAQIAGTVDFAVLIAIGNLALLFAVIVIGRMFSLRGLRNDWVKWSLLFLITMQPQPLKLMFYPMAVVHAYFGLLFSFLYLYYCNKDSNYYYVSFIFYAMTALTTGSGVFLGVIGIPLLFARKSYMRCATHFVFATCVLLLYAPDSSNLSYLIQNPMMVAKFGLLLLGGVSQIPGMVNYDLQIGFAIALLAYFVYIAACGFCCQSASLAKKHWTAIVCLFYLSMVISLIAIGRVSDYEANLWKASLDGRYRIYSILFLAICCIDLIDRISLEKIKLLFSSVLVVFAIVFNIAIFCNSVKTMRDNSAQRATGMKQWEETRDPSFLASGVVPVQDAERNLVTAIQMGIYKPD